LLAALDFVKLVTGFPADILRECAKVSSARSNKSEILHERRDYSADVPHRFILKSI